MKKLRSGLQRLRSSPQRQPNKPVDTANKVPPEGDRSSEGADRSSGASSHSSDWQPLKLVVNEVFEQVTLCLTLERWDLPAVKRVCLPVLSYVSSRQCCRTHIPTDTPESTHAGCQP